MVFNAIGLVSNSYLGGSILPVARCWPPLDRTSYSPSAQVRTVGSSNW